MTELVYACAISSAVGMIIGGGLVVGLRYYLLKDESLVRDIGSILLKNQANVNPKTEDVENKAYIIGCGNNNYGQIIASVGLNAKAPERDGHAKIVIMNVPKNISLVGYSLDIDANDVESKEMIENSEAVIDWNNL